MKNTAKEEVLLQILTIRHPRAKLIGCTLPVLPTNDEHLHEKQSNSTLKYTCTSMVIGSLCKLQEALLQKCIDETEWGNDQDPVRRYSISALIHL